MDRIVFDVIGLAVNDYQLIINSSVAFGTVVFKPVYCVTYDLVAGLHSVVLDIVSLSLDFNCLVVNSGIALDTVISEIIYLSADDVIILYYYIVYNVVYFVIYLNILSVDLYGAFCTGFVKTVHSVTYKSVADSNCIVFFNIICSAVDIAQALRNLCIFHFSVCAEVVYYSVNNVIVDNINIINNIICIVFDLNECVIDIYALTVGTESVNEFSVDKITGERLVKSLSAFCAI